MATFNMSVKEGMLVDRRWLQKQGFDRPSVDYFIRSGKLTSVGRGVYRKPGPRLKWQNVAYSLSQLGYHVHVGHLSSLKHHGFQHFLELGGEDTVRIYVDRKLPGWFGTVEKEFQFKVMGRNPFKENLSLGLEEVPFGTWDWPVQFSRPERAFLEALSTVTDASGIQQIDLMFEGTVGLRPEMLQSLLEECRQVKAKRLFLWMAKRHGHPWYKHINLDGVDLGAGKRQIVKNGVLDTEFMITVPREDKDEQTESLF